jgi:hypothetical protein
MLAVVGLARAIGASPAYAFDIPPDEDGHTHVAGIVTNVERCGILRGGGEASGNQTDPATYAYVVHGVFDPTAANTRDHRWVQDASGGPLVFDMGSPVLVVDLFPSIDHPPIPEEAFESTVYGSDDGIGIAEAGNITTVFDQGFDAAWISDDWAQRWQFALPHRYVLVAHGGPEAWLDDGDNEIDAVCAPDVTPPTPSCAETTNPSGNNVPNAGPNAGKSGQNPDGFYVIGAKDEVDPNPQVWVVDKGKDGVFGTADDTTFGPFASGTKIKYVEANGATPSQEQASGDIDWRIKGNGDFGVYAVDSSRNVSEHIQCHVPPPPK